MARALVVAGLVVLLAGIFLHLVVLIFRLAIPLGIGLLLIGVIWALIERIRGRR